MKKIFLISSSFVLIIFLVVLAALAQSKFQKLDIKEEKLSGPNKNISSEHIKTDLTCKTCHLTEYPTKNDPGLINCPRKTMKNDFEFPKSGPDVIVISEMSENYSGVVFSHKIHSQMSEMSTGCVGCHHYNTSAKVSNCRECHENIRNREDVSVPDLKAAYHRQCLTCHKQWSNENGCNTQCHSRKGSDNISKLQTLKEKSHPELKEPVKLTFQTNTDAGKMVTFYHDEHNKLFKINCKTCHSDDNCVKCHETQASKESKKLANTEKTFEEKHKNCVKCHNGNYCQKCHKDKESSPFNHGISTGWTLKSYHSRLACGSCHGPNMPYRKLNNNCTSCHKNFVLGKFEHRLIGLTLSENHKEIECNSCHTNGDFTKSPTCATCHDDKSFPSQLPGSRR